MKNNVHSNEVLKWYVLALMVVLLQIPLVINAQKGSKLSEDLEEANKLIKIGTELFKSLGKFVDAGKRTAEDFNKNVKVVKSEDQRPMVSPGQATKPVFKKGAFQNFRWEPVAYFDNQLFPSVIISMANYKGQANNALMNSIKSSALGIRFMSGADFIPVRWEIESIDKNYFDKVGGDFMMEGKNQETYFMPNIPWNMHYLAKHVSSSPINMVYRLYDEQGNKEERAVPLFMRSINDCLFLYKEQPLFFMFTAYVQEQHPEVDVILKEALKSKMVGAIDGYQGDEMNVIKQVAAVWKVLHDRGFQYSSITTTAANSTGQLASQQVRTFDMALKTQQANCVDGSVMLCSILRAINISTVLVIVPGHCFMGFYTSEKKENMVFVETTLMSDDEYLSKAKTPAEKQKAYMDQFEKALLIGISTYKKKKSESYAHLVDVDEYRNYIRPLPF
jgi:hypothetical protein